MAHVALDLFFDDKEFFWSNSTNLVSLYHVQIHSCRSLTSHMFSRVFFLK
jgi:hypothetical protein